MLTTELKIPQGPKGNFIFGCLLERRADPLGYFLKTAREFGDVNRYRLGPYWVVQLNHPDHVKHVMLDKAAKYEKGKVWEFMRRAFGDGLVVSDGEKWKKNRRITQPAFHGENLKNIYQSMQTTTQKLINRFENGPSNVDIFDEMCRFALDVASDTMFGGTFDEAKRQALKGALTDAVQSVNDAFLALVPMPPSVPTKTNRKLKRAAQTMRQIVKDLIDSKSGKAEIGKDVLSLLLRATDSETGEKMSAEQIIDECITFLVAGHETTANTLAWVFYCLSKNPEAYKKAREEALNVCGGQMPEFGQLSQLKYLQAVINETLRLYPQAWLISRGAAADDVIDGFEIKKGSIIVIGLYAINRDPRFWQNPEGFDPERFLDPIQIEKRHKYAFTPFGAGQRICIGNSFATQELLLLVSTVIQKYRIDLEPGANVLPEALVTIRPKGGLPMTLKKMPLAKD